MRNSNNTDWGEVGCVVIIGLFALPYILTSLLKALMPFILMGALGFCVYLILMYEQRTGSISRYVNTFFDEAIQEREQQYLPKPQQDVLELPPPKHTAELQELKKEVQRLKEEKVEVELRRKEDMDKIIQKYSSHIEHKQKEQLLNEFFDDAPKNYTQSDVFEKEQLQEQVKRKQFDLDYEGRKQELERIVLDGEKIQFDQEKKIFEVEMGAREDRQNIRTEMQEGFSKVDERFMDVEKKFVEVGKQFVEIDKKFAHVYMDLNDMKTFVTEKFSIMELNFIKETTKIKESVVKLKSDVQSEFSSVKLQFGREVLRLDKQQMKVLTQMEKYETQVKGFHYDMQKVQLEAKRFALSGQEVLNKAQHVNNMHQVRMQDTANKLQLGLDQIAIHKGDFANKVGSAKLMLDTISQDQYLALKDIGYEKMGVQMLRNEYQTRVTLETQKMNNLLAEQRRNEERMQERISHGQQVSDLKHRSHMLQENISFTRNRAALMAQENSLIRRLSK